MQPDLSPHTLVLEDDLIWLTVHGDFTLAHLDLLNQVYESGARSRGYLLTLMNVAEARLVSKEVRKKTAETARDIMGRGTLAAGVAYGGGPLLTGLVSLVFSAVRIVTGDAHKNRIVRTEAEGRAFLCEQRRQFRRQLGLDPPHAPNSPL